MKYLPQMMQRGPWTKKWSKWTSALRPAVELLGDRRYCSSTTTAPMARSVLAESFTVAAGDS